MNLTPPADPPTDPIVPTSDVSSDPPTSMEEPWKEMVRLADAGKSVELDVLVSGLSSTEQAHALSHLDEEETERVLRCCVRTMLPN